MKVVHKIFWEILPTNIDRTHTYGFATIARSRGMHQVHPNLHLHSLFKAVVIDVVNHCYSFISFKIHCLGLIRVPRTKVFLIEIYAPLILNLSCFCVVCQGINSQMECNQRSLDPTWQLFQLNVFDKPKARQAMLEMQEETKYGPWGEAIVNGVTIGDNYYAL
jgi:hypothetical protein